MPGGMNRFVLGGLVLLGLVVGLSGGARWVNGMTVELSLPALAAAIVLTLAFYIKPRRAPEPRRDRQAGLARRLSALLIDFTMMTLVITVPMALLSLLIEARHTGNFVWAYDRTFWRSTDLLGVLLAPVDFAAFFAYFYLHARSGTQTLGQYLAGIVTVGSLAEGARPNYFGNTFGALIGLGLWPLSLIQILRHPDKTPWWNIEAAVMTVEASSS